MADAPDILQTAKDDYEAAKSSWSMIYEKARDDLYFLSDEPNAQWIDKKLLKSRKNRPIYTVDQLGQFIHQVSNDIRMNTPTINVIPDGNDADPETADIYKGLIKAIEYKSNADAAYDTAVDFSVKSSIGFIKVSHCYTDENSLEQELRIDRCINPQSILIDPSSIQPDGSDAMFGFELETMTLKKFHKLYPKAEACSYGEKVDSRVMGETENVTIAHYYKIIETTTEKGATDDGELVDAEEGKEYKAKRKVSQRVVKHYILSGAEKLDESEFPGIYIPLVPVYGEEAWIEGERNLYSLIRKSKSSQMMYNLTKSLEIEVLMKQPQAPFMAVAGAVAGFENEFADPSAVNVLTVNPTDVNGNPTPLPQRVQPPVLPQGFAAMAAESKEDIKATMGLYNAAIGARSNETSGIAIQRRQQEGDVATFHFGDNLMRSICQVGRILVFAIPVIYDTARIIKVIGDEEEPKMVGVNGERSEEQERSFDLNKGKYDVRVITGASFTTQRQEAGAYYNQLIQSMPDLMPVIGDLVFKYQDTAGSQAISARLKKLVDPKLLDESEREEDAEIVDPEKEQMAQAMQAMQAQIQQMQAELQSKQVDVQLKAQDQQLKAQSEATKAQIETAKLQLEAKKLEIEQQKVEIDAYNAQKEVPQPAPINTQPSAIKLDTTGFQFSKTPEQEQLEAQKAQQEAVEIEMKMAQTNAVIDALNGIQQQVAVLSQATMASAEQTAKVAQNQDKPITVIRDEFGNITGAVQMFQSAAFQSIAFQTVTAVNDNEPKGGNDHHHYQTPYQKHRQEIELEEKVNREKTELERLENVLREVERKKELAAKNKLIAQAKRAEALARMEAAYQEEINRLRAIKADLMRRIKEDESILIIFMVMRKRRLRVA